MSWDRDCVVAVVDAGLLAWAALEASGPPDVSSASNGTSTVLRQLAQIFGAGSSTVSHGAAFASANAINLKFEHIWSNFVDFFAAIVRGWPRKQTAIVVVHSSDSVLLWEGICAGEYPCQEALAQRLVEFVKTDECTGASLLSVGLSQALMIINAVHQQERVDFFSCSGNSTLLTVTSGETSSAAAALGTAGNANAAAAAKNPVFNSDSSLTQMSLVSRYGFNASGCSTATNKGNNNCGRIILLDTGTDSHSTTNHWLLSTAFAAASSGICIDVCTIGLASSAAIQQLASITSGIHLSFSSCLRDQCRLSELPGSSGSSLAKSASAVAAAQTGSLSSLRSFSDATRNAKAVGKLFQDFLVFHFSISPSCRSSIVAIESFAADGAAFCHCHRRQVEVARICSSCLSVFCTDFREPRCVVCNVEFEQENERTLASTA